jgi:hypothetical protein
VSSSSSFHDRKEAFMYLTRSRWTTLFLAPLVLAVACGAPEEGEEMMGAEEEPSEMASEPTEETPMESSDPAAFSIELEELNASGVTGTAMATHMDESVEVTVSVMGVTDGEELPSHIHQGTCETGGGVVAPLNPVTVSEGSGSSVTSLAVDQIPADQPLFVQVHGSDGQGVACADFPAPHDEM